MRKVSLEHRSQRHNIDASELEQLFYGLALAGFRAVGANRPAFPRRLFGGSSSQRLVIENEPPAVTALRSHWFQNHTTSAGCSTPAGTVVDRAKLGSGLLNCVPDL
jgi:hypothetical protein